MDPNRLDQLARVLGSGQSRRRMLKTLTGGAMGAVAASVGFGEARAARKRSAGNVCAKNADCLSDACIDQGRGRKICACPEGTLMCVTGCLCGCPPGLDCASCQFLFDFGRICPAKSSCVGGSCLATTCTLGLSGNVLCAGQGASCTCATSTAGAPVCADVAFGSNCPIGDQCQTDEDCVAPGTVCVRGGNTNPPAVCTSNACLPVC